MHYFTRKSSLIPNNLSAKINTYYIHNTHLIFSQPEVDYEQDDANKGDSSNEDEFHKQIVWASFESL